MSAVRSRSSELITFLALALVEALPLQAWLVGPRWPDPWPLLGLWSVAMVVRLACAPGARRPAPTLLLLPCIAFAALRLPAGAGGVIYAFGAAAWLAARAASAASARLDPATVFGRSATAFIAVIVALFVRRTAAVEAIVIIGALLVASAVAALEARKGEAARLGQAVGERAAAKAFGQLALATVALAIAALLVLTPNTLNALVIVPFRSLMDLIAKGAVVILTPVAKLLVKLILAIRHHTTDEEPPTIDAGGPLDLENQQANEAMLTLVSQIAGAIVLVLLAWLVYRFLRVLLARLRTAPAALPGEVTFGRLDSRERARLAGGRHARNAASERLGSTAADQIRLLYRRVLAAAVKAGVAREPDETPARFGRRLAAASGAADATAVLTRAYEDVRYGAIVPDERGVTAARAAVATISTGLTPEQPPGRQ